MFHWARPISPVSFQQWTLKTGTKLLYFQLKSYKMFKGKGKMRIMNIVVANRDSLGFQNRPNGHQCMYILPDAPNLPLLRPCHDRKYATFYLGSAQKFNFYSMISSDELK